MFFLDTLMLMMCISLKQLFSLTVCHLRELFSNWPKVISVPAWELHLPSPRPSPLLSPKLALFEHKWPCHSSTNGLVIRAQMVLSLNGSICRLKLIKCFNATFNDIYLYRVKSEIIIISDGQWHSQTSWVQGSIAVNISVVQTLFRISQVQNIPNDFSSWRTFPCC